MQDLAALRSQITTSSVNVEVDASPQEDLARTLSEMRSQYEAITEKNRRDMECWYKAKVRRADDLKNQSSYHLIFCLHITVAVS